MMNGAYAWWRLARTARHGLLPPFSSPPTTATPTTAAAPWISALSRRRSDDGSRTAPRTASSAAVVADGDGGVSTARKAPRVIPASTIRQVHHLLFNYSVATTVLFPPSPPRLIRLSHLASFSDVLCMPPNPETEEKKKRSDSTHLYSRDRWTFRIIIFHKSARTFLGVNMEGGNYISSS